MVVWGWSAAVRAMAVRTARMGRCQPRTDCVQRVLHVCAVVAAYEEGVSVVVVDDDTIVGDVLWVVTVRALLVYSLSSVV